MNGIHSNTELKYKPRWLAKALREAIEDHPVIVLSGARQVGKSTLLRNELPFARWKYLTLDDFDILAQAKQEPASLWAGSNEIILDEVQKSANLLEAVKIDVDANPGKRRFILSGSANLLLMKQVSESLAGRAVYFTLGPMTWGEMNDRPASPFLVSLLSGKLPREGEITPQAIDPLPLIWKGFLPAVLRQESPAASLRWWEGYIITYLERDLRQLSQIESLPDFRRVMIALALRCGKMLNQTDIARDLGLSQSTIHRYINLLETTSLVERLPAFALNRNKRLVKSPKVMWADTGLAAFLAGHYEPEGLRRSAEAGSMFEAMIHHHLKVLSQLLTPKPQIFYWRTTTNKEIDFVIEWGRKLIAVEVKLSQQPKFADTGNLRLFFDEYPETVAGVLVHAGNEIKRMHEKIVAVPWLLLAGL